VSSDGTARRRDQDFGLRVIEVSVQKILECLDYGSLAKVGRIKSGSQPVSLASFGSSMLKHAASIHLL